MLEIRSCCLGDSQFPSNHCHNPIATAEPLHSYSRHIGPFLRTCHPYVYAQFLRHINQPQLQPVANFIGNVIQQLRVPTSPPTVAGLACQCIQVTDFELVVHHALPSEVQAT